MSQQILTKWHRFKAAAAADLIYFTAPKGGVATYWKEFPSYQPEQLVALVKLMDTLPKFVIERELVRLATGIEGLNSMAAMKEAGVARLPFPTLMIEIPGADQNHTSFIVLRDKQAAEFAAPWEEPIISPGNPEAELNYYGWACHLVHDVDGDYAVFPVSYIAADITTAVTPDAATVGPDGMPIHDKGETVLGHISWEGQEEVGPKAGENHWQFRPGLMGYLGPADASAVIKPVMELLGKVFGKEGRNVVAGIASALLIMSTRGVKLEAHDHWKLNRARTAKGKMPIPKYTYIQIGRAYYAKNLDDIMGVEREYVPDGRSEPHFVRAFNRRYHVGPGRTETIIKHFPSRFVCLPIEGELQQKLAELMPEYAEYHVRRGHAPVKMMTDPD